MSEPLRPNQRPPVDTVAGATDDGEPILAVSEAGRAAAEMLRAIARTARSFLYYDAANEAVREALQEVARRTLAAVGHGQLELAVRPDEILRAGEVVYREPDRERSLAFRLYRDGVRRIRVGRGVTWDELVALLGVLSIRYTGIRQQEDDIVTLLWRQTFDHIEVTAVEGVAVADPEDLDGHGDGGATSRDRRLATPFEEPVPTLSSVIGVSFRPLTSKQIQQLRDEVSPRTVGGDCVALAAELCSPVDPPAERLPGEPLAGMLRELRGFLLGTRQYLQVIALLQVMMRPDPRAVPADLVGELLAESAREDVLAELVSSALASELPPPAVGRLVAVMPAAALPRLMGLLAGRWTAGGRAIGLQLAEAVDDTRLATLVEALAGGDPLVAADLLEPIRSRNPDAATRLALAVLQRGGPDLRLRALELLAREPFRPEWTRDLVAGLDDSTPEVRCGIAQMLAGAGETRAFGPLLQRLLASEAELPGSEDAEALAWALAAIDPVRAFTCFQEWVRPPGTIARLQPRREGLWWAAASGLERIPGPEAATILREMTQRSSGALHDHCVRSTVRQRHLGGGSR